MVEEEFLKIAPEIGRERNQIQGGREHQAVASVLTVLIMIEESDHGIAAESIKRAKSRKKVKRRRDPNEAGPETDQKNQEDISFLNFYS